MGSTTELALVTLVWAFATGRRTAVLAVVTLIWAFPMRQGLDSNLRPSKIDQNHGVQFSQ